MKNRSTLCAIALAICFTSCEEMALTGKEEKSLLAAIPAENTLAIAAASAYYVDNTGGNDSNDGLSPSTAWKTVSKVNSVTFAAGDQILFKTGGSWTNRLIPSGSGTSGNPIVIGSYGTDAKPKINGAGVADGAICLTNQQYWEIRDIEVTNYNPSEEGGTSLATWESNNITNYANATLPAQAVKNNTAKIGILIRASDIGQVNHIYIQNVTIHGVNGTINQDDESSKNNGGLAFRISGTSTPTWFNDILVENCTFTHIDRTGAFSTSTWSDRTFSSNNNWKPALNLIFRNNTFTNIGANALIVRDADHPLMEHNLFDHCAIKISGNAAFNFNTDYAKWQYNECRFTKANVDDRDAGGIDSDYKTKNTIIQYNYIHDNDYGLLITGGGGSFNDQTLLKYNIIENDGKYAHPSNGIFGLKVSGGATNTQIYNNVINCPPGVSNYVVIVHSNWTVWPSNTSYYNNIIRNAASSSSYVLGSSTGNIFDYNIFNMNTATNQPSQTHNVTGLVKFVNPGAGDPDGYKLQAGSVALQSGKVITGNGGKDYFGNPVSSTTAPNIGAYNGAGL